MTRPKPRRVLRRRRLRCLRFLSSHGEESTKGGACSLGSLSAVAWGTTVSTGRSVYSNSTKAQLAPNVDCRRSEVCALLSGTRAIYLFRASEFFASESQDLFWKFVEQWNSVSNSVRYQTDKDLYDSIVRVSSNLLEETGLRFLKSALASRQYSPAVQVFAELYAEDQILAKRDCELLFRLNNNSFGCSLAELKEALKKTGFVIIQFVLRLLIIISGI